MTVDQAAVVLIAMDTYYPVSSLVDLVSIFILPHILRHLFITWFIMA